MMSVKFKMYTIEDISELLMTGKLLPRSYLPTDLLDPKYVIQGFDPLFDDYDDYLERSMTAPAPSVKECTAFFRAAKEKGYVSLLPIAMPSGMKLPDGVKYQVLLIQTPSQLAKLHADYPDLGPDEFLQSSNGEPMAVLTDGNICLM